MSTDRQDRLTWTAYTPKLKNAFSWIVPGEQDIFINPYTYNPESNGPPVFQRAITNKVYRNLLQNAMLRVSDQVTALHLARLKATENNGNMLFGASTIGLAGGASVVGGVITSRALAAAATGTAGARELFNDQIYRNALVETLIARIEADRASFKTDIVNLQTNNTDVYDVEAAIRDANSYHQLGSFYHGLTLIRADAEAANNAIRTNLNSEKILNHQIKIQKLQNELNQVKTGAITNPIVSPTNPIISPTNPIVSPTNPIVSPTNPIISPTNPIVSPTNPIISPTNPIISPTNPIISPTNPIISPPNPTVPTPPTPPVSQSSANTPATPQK